MSQNDAETIAALTAERDRLLSQSKADAVALAEARALLNRLRFNLCHAQAHGYDGGQDVRDKKALRDNIDASRAFEARAFSSSPAPAVEAPVPPVDVVRETLDNLLREHTATEEALRAEVERLTKALADVWLDAFDIAREQYEGGGDPITRLRRVDRALADKVRETQDALAKAAT